MKPQSIDDVLHKFVISALGTKDTSYEAVQKKARQALYEAVAACKPDKIRDLNADSYLEYQHYGYNRALEDWLTNLADLFGISKEGEKE